MLHRGRYASPDNYRESVYESAHRTWLTSKQLLAVVAAEQHVAVTLAASCQQTLLQHALHLTRSHSYIQQ
jgi:hypothetical protein